ncbi:MAG: TIGR03016 family PEP-CTERM system-associated outer membrane protein [Noviherbaspirillum sp.]
MLALAAQAAPALAAEWRFTPELTVRETYSDNITLAPAGSERSAFVTEVAPGFSITGEGRRSRLRATYQARGVMYSNNAGSSNIQNYLNADGTTELIDDLLFLDGQASIGQASTSAFGPRAIDSTYATGNRSEVRTYSISPYARKRYGNFAQGELRYLHQGTSSDNGAFANYSSDRINLNVSSGEAFRTLGWDAMASRQQSRYSDLDSVTSEYLNGTLRYRLTEQFALTGSAGYERYTYATPGDAPEGASWSVGFDWKPSPRTSVAATAGRRFYGDAYSFNGNHRSRYTTWHLSYNEDITTTQQQFADSGSVSTSSFLNQAFLANIPDAVARAQAVDAFIRATGLPATLANGTAGLSNRYFLQKRLQASVALTTGKSTAVLTAFETLRRPQSEASANNSFSGGNLLFSDESRQRGLSGLYSLRLSPITSVNVNGQYYRTTSLSTDITDDNKLLTLGLSHQLSPKVSGTVELRRYQGTFNQTGSDFRENAISAYLSMRL